MNGALSDLVVEGLAATAVELGADPELLQTPVDHHERAVLVVATPDLLAVKVDTRADHAQAERRALDKLASVAPVPKVVFTADAVGDNGVWVTGLSWVAGDPIDQLRGEEAALTDRWRDAGEMLNRIHRCDVRAADDWPLHISHPTRRDEWIDAVISGGADGLFTESATKELRRQLDSLRDHLDDREQLDVEPAGPEPTGLASTGLEPTDLASTGLASTGLVHGDASPQHVLGSVRALSGLIDLGDVGIGDPSYDLATLTLWFPQRLVDVAGANAAAPGFAERVRFHRLLRFAGGACWLRDHDFDPTPHLEGLYGELLGETTT